MLGLELRWPGLLFLLDVEIMFERYILVTE